MRTAIAFFLTVATSALPGIAQTEWSRPADVQSGQPGRALVVVDGIDVEGRKISGSFAESDFGVALNITSGSRFRGFGDPAGEVIGFGGMAEVLPGDRIRVYGTGSSNGVIQAEDLRLVGRQVEAAASALPAVIEGVVRSVSRSENRFSVETDDRRLWTVVGEPATPVEFEGRTFAIGNLEVGDSVRVTVSSWDGTTPLASSVVVTADAREAMEAVTSVSGRVSAIRSSARVIVLETPRGDLVTMDMAGATDESGRRLAMSDLTIGRELDVIGRRMADGTFRATTVRGIESSGAPVAPLRTVELRGIVRSVPDEVGWMRLELPDGSADVLVDPIQPVRMADERWSTPTALREGDSVHVRGIDAGDGAIIAQVISIEDPD